MALEYCVAFTDAKSGNGDITPGLIKKFKNLLKNELKAEYSFSRKFIPYVGEMNIFKTNKKQLAELAYQTLEDCKKNGLEMRIFPVKAGSKKQE